MATSLLEKTRKINRLLQRSENVEYDGISRVLSNVLGANVYITNKKGKIYGYAFIDDFECDLMVDKVINQGSFPKGYVNWLLRLDETSANLHSKTGMCAYDEDVKCMFNGKNTTVVPIYGVGERIG
ncbi:MAG: GTP-sensing pleiotropic transcriptional regulator CodY, partial [Selenomonadaceae bacterium]|nr:GTP-sensing pleiotropic transcriptional regulator CodY [Selenomonadaceae bacterium]